MSIPAVYLKRGSDKVDLSQKDLRDLFKRMGQRMSSDKKSGYSVDDRIITELTDRLLS